MFFSKKNFYRFVLSVLLPLVFAYGQSTPASSISEKFKALVCKNQITSGLFIASFSIGVPPYEWELFDSTNSEVNKGSTSDTFYVGGLIKGETYKLQWKDATGFLETKSFTIGDAPELIHTIS